MHAVRCPMPLDAVNIQKQKLKSPEPQKIVALAMVKVPAAPSNFAYDEGSAFFARTNSIAWAFVMILPVLQSVSSSSMISLYER